MFIKDHPKTTQSSKVYLIQEIPGTSRGEPKYNILGVPALVPGSSCNT